MIECRNLAATEALQTHYKFLISSIFLEIAFKRGTIIMRILLVEDEVKAGEYLRKGLSMQADTDSPGDGLCS